VSRVCHGVEVDDEVYCLIADSESRLSLLCPSRRVEL
jgi:hypothetical protein